MDETCNYAVSGDLIKIQTEGRCFCIMDEPARAAARPDPSITDKLKLGLSPYNWVADTILEKAKEGKVIVAETLAELAKKAGIRSDALQGTISAYNAGVARGEDKLFLKEGEKRPISTPPFYAIEVRASQFGITGAGLRIDADTCVYSNAEEKIPGLYAAGETTGGIHGDRYTGSGSSIAMAIVYGRIAGRSAAAFAAQIE
jgi:fumarate reductase flavoprotein subunit